MRWLSSVLMILIGMVTSYAQFDNPIIINEKSGLSSNTVRKIVQDHYGFVWISTFEGLNRFDGSQFTHFKHIPGDKESILSSVINSMIVDSSHIWIGGKFGISGIHLDNFEITNVQIGVDGRLDSIDMEYPYSAHIANIVDDGGVLWVGSSGFGLFRYQKQTGVVESYPLDAYQEVRRESFLLSGINEIVSMIPDVLNDSIIWCGTNRALVRFNKFSANADFFYYGNTEFELRSGMNVFRRLYQHSDGLIYYLTWSGGFYNFDPETKEFSTCPIDPNEFPEFWRHGVRHFKYLSDDQILMTTGRGVFTYDIHRETITESKLNDPENQLIYGQDLIDHEGRIWVVSDQGVRIYDPLLQQFDKYSYQQFAYNEEAGFGRDIVIHDNQELITVATQGGTGLYHMDLSTGEWFRTEVERPPGSEDPRFGFRSIAEHETLDWVINGYTHLFTFNPGTFETKLFAVEIPSLTQRFSDVLWDSDAKLWIGTFDDGLFRYDPVTGRLAHFSRELLTSVDNNTLRPMGQFIEDSRGNIWFGRMRGFGVYLREEERFHQFIFDENPDKSLLNVMNFALDAKGDLWVSGQGQIGHIDVDKPLEGVQYKIDLFPSETEDYFNGIIADSFGNIWGIADRYIYKVDEDRNVSAFSFDYTSTTREFFSFEFLPSGKLALGKRSELLVVDLHELRKNKTPPIPYLREIGIQDVPLQGNFIHAPKHLRLKYDENYLSFSFSAISYTLADQNRYQYRLTGFDDHWIEARDRRFVNYTNVPPGSYTFELQVANNEGIWSEPFQAASIIIKKAWWNTWLFRASAMAAFISLLYFAYRYRIRQIRKEEEIKSSFEKQLASVELSALRAQMNPHFIFNSLNSIENFIIKNDTFKAAEYINDFARLMRLILQNSRSKYINLQDEIEALDLYLEMESLRFDNKFDYEIQVAEGIQPDELEIPPMLIQPFVENAIWHGLMHKPEGGKVEINIERQNGLLYCAIEDNGIGREKAREINASNKARGKKSMGMEITQTRIQVINEVYNTNTSVVIRDLVDTEGNPCGTRVELNIPL